MGLRITIFFLLGIVCVLGCEPHCRLVPIKKNSQDKCISENSVFSQYLTHYKNRIVPSSQRKSTIYALMDSMYIKGDYDLFWIRHHRPSKQAIDMYTLLCGARDFGLDPSFYNVNELKWLIRDILQETNIEQLKEWSFQLERKLSYSSLLFMSHLKYGVFKTDSLLSNDRFYSVNKEFSALLLNSIENNDVPALLRLQPSNYLYRTLQKAVVRFLDSTILDTASIIIPDLKSDSVACYRKIHELLISAGYLCNGEVNSDSMFFDGIKKVQRDFGLEQDGIIGPYTREALSTNTYQKYLKMAINMERLKGECFNDSSYVLINVPSFEMMILEDNKVVDTLRVIVGTSYTRTPDITSQIDRIVTHPIWKIPRSIAVWEILPRIKRDSNYLLGRRYYFLDKRNNIIDPRKVEWDTITRFNFPFRIHQERGGNNPLGGVKFEFVSPYTIYMHDTPNRKLFERDIRSFSHGCIRLQNPAKFMNYLLMRENNNTKTDSLLHYWGNNIGGNFELEKPLKIKVRYYTCLANEKQQIFFFKDIYQKDYSFIVDFFKKGRGD